jgi:hypothetical protein
MKTFEDSEAIVDHAVESEDNLRMAVCVGLAFDRLKEKIVREFTARLIAELRTRLGKSWAVKDAWSKTPLKKGYISVRKEQWAGNLAVCLGCEKVGPSELYWSTWPEKTLNTAKSAELKAALDEQYAPGFKNGAINPWWKWVDKPFGEWNTEEALIGLWNNEKALNGFWNKEEAVEYYTSHLVRIAKIADAIV